MLKLLSLVFATALAGVAHAQTDGPACFQLDPISTPRAAIAACTDVLLQDDLATDTRSEALVTRGVALRAIGSFDRSIADLEAALDTLGQDGSTMRMLAWTYREMGRLRDAHDMFTQILGFDDHWQGYLSRCVVRLDLEFWGSAVADCYEARHRAPEVGETWFFYARALNYDQQPQRAFRIARAAREQWPEDPRHGLEEAWALWLMGDAQRAGWLVDDLLGQHPGDLELLQLSDMISQN